MKYLLKIILIAQISWLASCQPEPLDIDIPQAEQKLVVASQFSPYDYEGISGNALVVTLSKSFSALDPKETSIDSTGIHVPDELLVDDAEIILSDGMNEYVLEKADRGIYFLQDMIKMERHAYTLTATDRQSGKKVVAQTIMMPKVAFDTIAVTPVENQKNQYIMHYTFTDIAGEQNWYVVNYYTKDNKPDNESKDPKNVDYIARRMMEQRLDYDLISEADIVNGQYNITKKFTNNKLDTFGISLTNITKGYYDFLVQQKKAGMLFNQIRGEVINYPSNVQNGLGYFNLQTPDVHVISMNP